MAANKRQAEAIAQVFNEQWPAGTDVYYVNDHGIPQRTRTRSQAWVAAESMVIVSIEGRSGGVDLGRIIVCAGKVVEDHLD